MWSLQQFLFSQNCRVFSVTVTDRMESAYNLILGYVKDFLDCI